ncbi:ribonuclease III [Thiobacillus denitrificans ATCC 25259]|uniref:Ribonuclease 3 n=1 Tax=Thiobacillus denitrificans (strain ATCC 25259 / T1) TaxID=292415 RepID=RNC_THIDA|nr:ribonuclease III [Thiobacillus denitrificans]Q3SH50.1 RecName: Full=Ribonuclease 3; AltName: Full=Ribonuclease III; Short=RNase III [Thiobacillus denitrificans ATCC 25259]AAZ98039.1 ribonuclease III [Thiobacillus denitrificans ATCC 25259]
MNNALLDARLQQALGYTFSRSGLLQQALTHRSYGALNNERLEFLGDSVLNCSVARALYDAFPDLPEGSLSRLRANLVRQETLAEIAGALRLGDSLRLGEGELKSGGFRRPSILADALESLFGAVFLDAGFDEAQRVVRRLFDPLVAQIDPKASGKDPKTRLQEILQSRRLPLPEYRLVGTEGEAHDQSFIVECLLAKPVLSTRGTGKSRRAAEQEAARQACAELQR